MKRFPKVLLIVSIILGLLFAFNNCTDVKFTPMDTVNQDLSSDDPGTPSEDPPTAPPEIAKKCDLRTNQVKNINITFPKESLSCAWNAGGNLGKQNGYFQARHEQNEEFVLPVGATICDIDFRFSKQSFRYDDHIIFTLNDRILATSYDWNNLFTKDTNDLMVYKWEKIKGKKWNDDLGTVVYCAGQENGKASCAWPNTDTPGEIKMDFDKSIIQKIMAASVNLDKHNFKFVTTGDNDDPSDCRHTEVSFSVDIHYVE